MSWTEEQVDELISNVQRDFALGRTKPVFWLKVQNRGISLHLAEKVISKKSYIIEYDHEGPRIGFLNPSNHIFVAWKPNYPTSLKSCFIADGGLDYLKRQYDCKFIWLPR